MRNLQAVERYVALRLAISAIVFLFATTWILFASEVAAGQTVQVVAFVGARVIPGDGSGPIDNPLQGGGGVEELFALDPGELAERAEVVDAPERGRE